MRKRNHCLSSLFLWFFILVKKNCLELCFVACFCQELFKNIQFWMFFRKVQKKFMIIALKVFFFLFYKIQVDFLVQVVTFSKHAILACTNSLFFLLPFFSLGFELGTWNRNADSWGWSWKHTSLLLLPVDFRTHGKYHTQYQFSLSLSLSLSLLSISCFLPYVIPPLSTTEIF